MYVCIYIYTHTHTHTHRDRASSNNSWLFTLMNHRFIEFSGLKLWGRSFRIEDNGKSYLRIGLIYIRIWYFILTWEIAFLETKQG